MPETHTHTSRNFPQDYSGPAPVRDHAKVAVERREATMEGKGPVLRDSLSLGLVFNDDNVTEART